MKKLVLMIAMLVSVFASGCSSPSRRSEPAASAMPKTRAFKGIELYSWQANGVWHFALLPGTNGMKPESMVKSASLTLAQVEQQFTEYAEGECIFWQSGTGYDRPDSAIVQRLETAAQKLKLSITTP